jgi:hypothetical protein
MMKNSLILKIKKGSVLFFVVGAMCGFALTTVTLQFLVSRAADKGIDSDAIPASSGSLGIGTGAYTWASVNDVIYFSGSLVGIGAVPTNRELEVAGGVRLATDKSRPSCASGVRGLWWYTGSATGTKDILSVCAKDAADAYSWRTIY